MKPFYLVETVTRDKLIHQGLFYRPKNPGKKAILLVHGLTSTFYGGIKLLEALADECENAGFGLATFNNRGHDMITGIRKVDRRKPKGYGHMIGGAGYENFKDCIYDIEAGVDFLANQGFSEIIITGSSTGANKVCFYASKTKNPHVLGFVLASPSSDRLTITDKNRLEKNLLQMQDFVNQGKSDELQIGYHFFPLTPKRYLSLFIPNSLEDTFDYGDPRPRLTYFSRIRKPLLVILGEIDESLDRSPEKVLSVFAECQTSVNYKSVIIPGSLHGFDGKEARLVKIIVAWVKNL